MYLSEKTKKRTINWLVSGCVAIALIIDSSLMVVVDAAQAEAAQGGRLDGFRMVMGALAGLVLFLYGVTRMSEGLKAIAGERMKENCSASLQRTALPGWQPARLSQRCWIHHRLRLFW